MKQELNEFKAQIGTQFRYIGSYLCSGTKGDPVETTIPLDDFGVYLLFTTQGGSWDEGSMIFVDYTDDQSKSTILCLPENKNFSVSVSFNENKQIIIANKALANFFVTVYKVAKRAL